MKDLIETASEAYLGVSKSKHYNRPELYITEGKTDAPDEYKDFLRDHPKDGKLVLADNNGTKSIKGEKASKNWPSGAPIGKTFKKATVSIPSGEFWVLETSAYWYFIDDNNRWCAVPISNGTPPFDY